MALVIFAKRPELRGMLPNGIRAARNAARLTIEQLAEEIGISVSQLSRIETGSRRARVAEMEKIAQALGVSVATIMEPAEPSQERPRIYRESSVDHDIGRAEAVDTIREIDVRAGAGGGGIPVEAWVSDGNGNTYAAEGILAHWEIPPAVMQSVLRATAKHIRAFEVIGDSMEPRLYEGDRVFIDLRYTVPSPEGIFALWDGYGVVVKRVEIVRGSDPLRVRIISANASYTPYEVALDDIKIIGRYAGRFTAN